MSETVLLFNIVGKVFGGATHLKVVSQDELSPVYATHFWDDMDANQTQASEWIQIGPSGPGIPLSNDCFSSFLVRKHVTGQGLRVDFLTDDSLVVAFTDVARLPPESHGWMTVSLHARCAEEGDAAKKIKEIGFFQAQFARINLSENASRDLFANGLPDLKPDKEYLKHLKENAKHRPAEIGHRGVGVNRFSNSPHLENTISSFLEAAKRGADAIELDIQITKDNQIVIWHDFTVWLESRGHKVDVNGLTLEELRNLTHPFGSDVELGDERIGRPFPTLAEVCASLKDHSVFLNLEVKFPMQLQTLIWESNCAAGALNEFVDRLLLEIGQLNVDPRRLSFASFEPNVCLALRMKQNAIPVIFLTQGSPSRYPAFLDWRSRASQRAVAFARRFGFTVHVKDRWTSSFFENLEFIKKGVAFHAEELLNQSVKPLNDCRSAGLCGVVWGSDLNNERCRVELANADGLIYDGVLAKQPAAVAPRD